MTSLLGAEWGCHRPLPSLIPIPRHTTDIMGACPVPRFPHIYKPGSQGLRGLGAGQSTDSWGRADGPPRIALRALKDCLPNKLCELINELHQTTLQLGRERTSLGNRAVRVSRAALAGPGCPSPAVGPLHSLLCRNPTSGSASTRGSVASGVLPSGVGSENQVGSGRAWVSLV